MVEYCPIVFGRAALKQIEPEIEISADDRMVRLPKVLETVDVSRTTLWRAIRGNKFPKPVKLLGTSLWSMNQVQAWIEDAKKRG